MLDKSSDGALDYYINGKRKWAIELLREGDRMEEHEKHFLNGGIYASSKINDWLIVDFRSERKPIRGKSRAHFMHVCYSADFTKATILRKGSCSPK